MREERERKNDERERDEEEERCAVRSACGGATTRSFGQRQRIVTNGSRDGVQHCTTIGRSERDGWHTTPASGTARPLQRPEKKNKGKNGWKGRTEGQALKAAERKRKRKDKYKKGDRGGTEMSLRFLSRALFRTRLGRDRQALG